MGETRPFQQLVRGFAKVLLDRCELGPWRGDDGEGVSAAEQSQRRVFVEWDAQHTQHYLSGVVLNAIVDVDNVLGLFELRPYLLCHRHLSFIFRPVDLCNDGR